MFGAYKEQLQGQLSDIVHFQGEVYDNLADCENRLQTVLNECYDKTTASLNLTGDNDLWDWVEVRDPATGSSLWYSASRDEERLIKPPVEPGMVVVTSGNGVDVLAPRLDVGLQGVEHTHDRRFSQAFTGSLRSGSDSPGYSTAVVTASPGSLSSSSSRGVVTARSRGTHVVQRLEKPGALSAPSMGTKVIRRGKPPPKMKPTRRYSTLNSLKARVAIEEPEPEPETADGPTDGKMDSSELEDGHFFGSEGGGGNGIGNGSRIGDGGDGISNDVLESMNAASRERVLQDRERRKERERYRLEYRSFCR